MFVFFLTWLALVQACQRRLSFRLNRVLQLMTVMIITLVVAAGVKLKVWGAGQAGSMLKCTVAFTQSIACTCRKLRAERAE